ncbi:MAG: glutamine amidotransferase [Planctomycetia bacterium]|nr:glutamine amidotransferase [Planctomycetia bacterium]
MSKSSARLPALIFLSLLLPAAWSFAAPPVVIQGEKLPGTKARLKDVPQTFVVATDVAASVPLGLGRVRVQAFLRDNGKGTAFRSTPITLSVGDASAKMTVDALSAGAPLSIDLINRADRLAIRVQQGQLSVDAKKEVLKLETTTGTLSGPGSGSGKPKKKKSDDPLAELGLSEAPPVDASASVLPMVLLDRIEVRSLSGPVLVSTVGSDRLTYRPGDTAKIMVALENLSTKPTQGKLTVELVQGLSERTPIFSGDVQLPAGGTVAQSYSAPVGSALWGRGVEVRLETPEGSDVGTHAFSVVTNPWMVALHGRGLPQFGSERWTPEQAEQEAERIAQANMAAYANMYEAFAWAPCDFSKMTIDDDATFHSGQTQYTKNRAALATLHRVFHRYGLACITYGKSCAAGVPGVEYALKHPEQMNVFSKAGFAHEAISVDVLDRMLENRYRRHGRDEDFWQSWISSWTLIGNHAATDFGCDEIVRSAKQFGWDGVRYDGHFNYYQNPAMSARMVKHAADRIQSQIPGFALGYNYCGPQHNTAEGAATDVELAACARAGGLIMSEYYRGILGPVPTNIEHLRSVGDATRLHGGYFLCISDESSVWNQALMLAGGARPMGGGGHFNKFATRFSEFMFDPGLRRLADPRKVVQPVNNADFRWDAFVYEKSAGPDRSWLVMQLVNATDKLTLHGQNQPPSGVSGPRENVTFKLALPAGYQALSVVACDDPTNFTTTVSPVVDGLVTVPSIGVWSLVAIELRKETSAPALHTLCDIPLNFAKPGSVDAEKARAALQLSASTGPEVVRAVNEARVKVTPEVLAEILAQGEPIDNNPGAQAHLPVDFSAHRADVDAQLVAGIPAAPPFQLRRNGRPDVLVVRGVFSHWDRVEQAAVMLPSVELHDASLVNGRIACSVPLAKDNIACLEGWPTREGLAEMDAVVLDDLPATAFTLEQRRDLRDYVSAGGSLLVMGGWYSLSKGSWEGSFLEEALPLETLQAGHLLRLQESHRSFAATADYAAALGASAPDFGTSAAIEWINHVRVRPAAKVLMKVGEAPLLIGGNFGAGNVLVWTGSHSGMPETPYWQNAAWPKLVSQMLKSLTKGAEQRSTPSPEIAARLAKEVKMLTSEAFEDALGGSSKQAVTKPKTEGLDRLRFLLAQGGEAEALVVATYLLENPSKVDPQAYNELIESIGFKIKNDAGWSKLGEKFLKAPPLMLETLVAEIAATSVKSIRFETIQAWKLQDPVMRLRCIAASADPAALPTLEAELRQLADQDVKWTALQVADNYNTSTVFDIYRTRLLRPFVAQALWRCGRRNAETAEQFCQGVLELPFYAWRQRWILEGARAGLRDAIQQGGTGLEAKTRIRETEIAIRKLERARQLLDAQFYPETIGLESATCQAAARALQRIDSRKSLPLALRYLRMIPDDKLGEFSALSQAKLPDVQQLYRERSSASPKSVSRAGN